MKIKAKLIICFSAICIGCMLIAMLCVLVRTRNRFDELNDMKAKMTARYYASAPLGKIEAYSKSSIVKLSPTVNPATDASHGIPANT